MNNHQAPSLPQYYNRTSLGSVLETRCRAAIDAFEALQIRNAIALLASAKERAIEAASNAVEHAFRFLSMPPPPAPTLITNDAAVPADGSFVGHLNYGSYRVWNTPTCRPNQEEAVEQSRVIDLLIPALDGVNLSFFIVSHYSSHHPVPSSNRNCVAIV